MQETWVWSLGSGISSREGNGATHSSILAWRIPWKRSLAGYCPQGCKESDITEQDLTSRKCWRIYKTPVRANKQIQQSYRIQKSTYKNQLYFYLPVISDQKKMEKTIPFMRVSKKNQILKNLTKKVKDLYTETANVKPVLLTQSCWLFAICGQESARLLHLWDSPGKKTGVGCHFLLQGIFLTEGSSSGLPHLQADSLPAEPPGKPSPGRKVEKTQTSGNTPHTHGLTRRHQYCPKWLMESMQSLSKSQWWFLKK